MGGWEEGGGSLRMRQSECVSPRDPAVVLHRASVLHVHQFFRKIITSILLLQTTTAKVKVTFRLQCVGIRQQLRLFLHRHIISIMSEVLPYKDNMNHYGDNGDEEQISITCRLQNNANNFFGSTPTKRAPKLGQIGRSKRVVIEDDQIDEVLNNTAEKSSAGV